MSRSKTNYEKYLYKDQQSDTLSKVGAYITHLSERLLHHGPIEFQNLDKLKTAEPSLIAPTHQSSTDIPVMGWAALKAGLRPPSFIAKVGLVDERKVTGRLLPFAGAFYIEQSKKDRPYIEAHINRKLESGRSVVMFPEGTRRPESRELKLERGLGVLAVRFGLEITPIGIYGPINSRLGGNSPVGVVIGDSIKAEKNPIKFRSRLTELLTDLRQQAKDLAGY